MEIVVKTVGRREFDKVRWKWPTDVPSVTSSFARTPADLPLSIVLPHPLQSSQLCVNTLSQIFRDDASGYTSLELVKLLSRTIKARSYLVHPAVLTCLLSIRFQDLGGIRASTDRIERDRPRQQQPHRYHNDKKGRKGANDKPYMNKKTRKVLKEKKEIEKEIAEAENVVKEEERSHNSTETLKLLFALYFRILKLPVEQKSELLPPALEGLARFATLINVDFFRDLLNVLKDIMGQTRDIRIELLCVVTALQLLTGQGGSGVEERDVCCICQSSRESE